MEKTGELFAAIQQRNAARVCELLAADAALARAHNPQGVSWRCCSARKPRGEDSPRRYEETKELCILIC